jgi:integrase
VSTVAAHRGEWPRGQGLDLGTRSRHRQYVYRWAVESGFIAENPIVQRPARSRLGQRRRHRDGQTPAETPKDSRTEDLAWFPPPSYRQWRDVGVRGYCSDGLRDSSFRGRNAARNAVFCDLMVRTGMRLSEQASLTVFEVPDLGVNRAYAPTWLPSAVAKNGSGRRIYVPATVLRDVWDYIDVERQEVIELARSRGTYDDLASALVVEDPERPVVIPPQSDGRKRPVETLKPRQRRNLLVRRTAGLEPAALWLNQDGLPMRPRTWQSMFTAANERCARHGVVLRAHPHLLRHTYAVVTLEQLQREHIRELRTMTSAQRTSYEQIFGDPLDWVRRRLGHRSVETTFKYLHTLNELAMETRMALVPNEWDAPSPPEPEAARGGAELAVDVESAAAGG